MSPGRRNAASIPLHVRASGLRLAPSERLYIRRKLGSKLSKFASSVERASVRLEDVNGPRGGVEASRALTEGSEWSKSSYHAWG